MPILSPHPQTWFVIHRQVSSHGRVAFRVCFTYIRDCQRLNKKLAAGFDHHFVSILAAATNLTAITY
jgi:hypothetical protein